MLADDELVLADKGYRDGLSYFLTLYANPKTAFEIYFNRQHKSVMARSESVNKRIRHFAVLQIFSPL